MFKNAKGFGTSRITKVLGLQNSKGFGDSRMPKVLGIQE